MNIINLLGQAIIKNMVAVLFLLGLILINIAIYIRFDYVIGIFATGITLIIISLIYQFERAQQPTKK